MVNNWYGSRCEESNKSNKLFVLMVAGVSVLFLQQLLLNIGKETESIN